MADGNKVNLELVKYLVSNGAHVNAKSKDDLIPLHLTTDVEIAKYLVTKGANVNAKDKDGKTPLFFAVNNRNVEFIEFIISKGADVNAKDKDGHTTFDCLQIERKRYLDDKSVPFNTKAFDALMVMCSLLIDKGAVVNPDMF